MKNILFFSILFLLQPPLNAQDLADLFEANKRSVVTIYVAESVSEGTGDPRTFTDNMGLGSGVLVRDYVVLTASHVVTHTLKVLRGGQIVDLRWVSRDFQPTVQ